MWIVLLIYWLVIVGVVFSCFIYDSLQSFHRSIFIPLLPFFPSIPSMISHSPMHPSQIGWTAPSQFPFKLVGPRPVNSQSNPYLPWYPIHLCICVCYLLASFLIINNFTPSLPWLPPTPLPPSPPPQHQYSEIHTRLLLYHSIFVRY